MYHKRRFFSEYAAPQRVSLSPLYRCIYKRFFLPHVCTVPSLLCLSSSKNPGNVTQARRLRLYACIINSAVSARSKSIKYSHALRSSRCSIQGLLATLDRRVLVEEGIKHPRELEVAIMGNHALYPSPVGEIEVHAAWNDHDTK